MKAKVLFLTGLGTLLTGAFIRSCASDISAQLANSWCGIAPRNAFLGFGQAHEHCAGCIAVAAGIALVSFSPLLIDWSAQRRARARCGMTARMKQ